MNEESRSNEESEELASDQPEFREISVEELKEILSQHQIWLGSEGEEGEKANLSNANLPGVKLEGANLQKADLREANLQDANLRNADLYQANLEGADLEGADLEGADLQDANLQSAYLYLAELQGATLNAANLQDTDLQDADFCEAVLIGVDFQNAYLYGTKFQEATLIESNFQGATLIESNFQGADLYKADLKEAELLRTVFREASLQDSDLTDVKGLLAGQLAGANVSGAKLPEAISKFEGLKIVDEASKNARKLFFGMLLGCVYAVLTIATTTDLRLLTNSASSPLPIIGTQIPIVGFYLVAPIILLCVYVYCHLYLQRLWEGLGKLPAIFPDGRPLYEKAYPWLLNGLVCTHFKLLRSDRPYLSRLQIFISTLVAWCVVPATLLLFWVRFLRRHDLTWTSFHALLLGLSIGVGFVFYRLARATLRGKQKKPFLWKRMFKDLRTYKRSAIVLGILGVIIFFYVLSYGAIEGIRPGLLTKEELNQLIKEFSIKPYDIRIMVPRAFYLIGYSPFVHLREVDVSIKPPNWSGKEEEIKLVKGASLIGKDLRCADLSLAFLVKAHLDDTDLSGAYLYNADLRHASLIESALMVANLIETNLYRADLSGADLFRAKLYEANLEEANLEDANLKEAKGLTIEQLSRVKTLYNANLDLDLMEQIKEKYPYLLEKPKPGEEEY